jgi:hypothetical protein
MLLKTYENVLGVLMVPAGESIVDKLKEISVGGGWGGVDGEF